MEILFTHKNIYQHFTIVLVLFIIRGKAERQQLIPSFIPDKTNHVVVNRGDTAILKCKIRNLGPKAPVWRKVSEFFPLSVGKMMYAPNEEMSIDYHENDPITTSINLIIKRANPSHSGTYECQISAANVYTYHVNLTVLRHPKPVQPSIRLTGTKYLNSYQRLNLTCNATGTLRAPEAIDWFFDGNLIDEKNKKWWNRVVVSNFIPEDSGRSFISQLTVERVVFEDAGIYVCRSSAPSINTDVETTSINVHVLGGDNITKIKREGDNTQNDPQQRSESKASSRLGSDFYLILMVIFSKTLR
ncbi:zwei Ig domain protein zig-8-like [Mytilus galloprovincialis]|uniref:zwei Ig domain protein zig-8-like n=1 Tax=Mytilus galloprovincialis TaxID=29158 RepID=UPI003F7BFE46